MDDKNFEMGIGAHGMFGRDQLGIGTGAWMHAEVVDDVELVARAHATDFFAYDGTAKNDVLTGGSVGVRGRYRYLPHLLVGGEALLDYQARTASGEQFVTGIVGIPVAELAAPGLWVYTNISLGLAVPLRKNAIPPFFGIQEIPIGVAWQATDWLVVVGEGGFALPIEGGYGGVAVACRL
jgi:hypothetical protein